MRTGDGKEGGVRVWRGGIAAAAANMLLLLLLLLACCCCLLDDDANYDDDDDDVDGQSFADCQSKQLENMSTL